jgi:hypothetical protein
VNIQLLNSCFLKASGEKTTVPSNSTEFEGTETKDISIEKLKSLFYNG